MKGLCPMAIELTIRKWGNSFGAVIPIEIIEKENLKENSKIKVELVKEANLKSVFGALKRKMSGQEFKDMVREGWS